MSSNPNSRPPGDNVELTAEPGADAAARLRRIRDLLLQAAARRGKAQVAESRVEPAAREEEREQ
jgi:hypothetical protein